MDDRINCPKCNQETFENPRYYSVRGEMVLFDGKCVNCGYDITAEELYNDLKGKYDFEEDFDIVKWPLENILEKCSDKDLNIKYLILTFFIRIYDDKLRNAIDHEKITQYFDKKIQYQQVLERRKFSEKETLRELARIFENKPGLSISAKGYYEQIISLDLGDPKSYLDLANAITEGWYFDSFFNEAINNYKLWFELSLKNCDPYSRIAIENEYYKNLARLYIRKGGREDLRKALELIEKIDLKTIADSNVTKAHMVAFEREKIVLEEEIQAKELPFPILVRALELRALVRLEDFERAIKVYDEIEKIDPSFMEHYYYKETKNTKVGNVQVIEGLYFYHLFYDLEDSRLFANLTELYWKIGRPRKIGEIYLSTPFPVYTDYSEIEHMVNIPLEDRTKILVREYFELMVIAYLTAKSMFTYIQTEERQDSKDYLINYCLKLFESASTFYVGLLAIDWMRFPEIYIPLIDLIGEYENCQTDCHIHRGELYKLKNDYDNAFAEYKNAQRYDPDNQEIIIKIENLREKFISDLHIEVENLNKIETKDIPVDTTKRIMSLLGSIKNSFPEHHEETKELVEKLGDTRPYILLNPLRRTAEEYFYKIYKGSKDKDFLEKVNELCDRNEINAYIKNLLVLIWSIGSRGSHPLPQYVKDLKLEDIEVIISAEVRFLNWYMEKYSKQK